ncbi:hypothetical protein B0H66DRAFT_540474 [Apodospora peruviana]|uniref:BZIP domain-containing protein n=1 Tax=Apodospora peruviana TaxID=516989 RepID=A0AAE0IQ87_9PEZI|nr:hypothetical protein B0H66DRAFT_540474 [Apodospora peruviana]
MINGTNLNQPASSTAAAPCIQIGSMPQLAEARSRQDDWTGTNDAAARRRAQTRLNTRAYRKRKAEKAQASRAGMATVAATTTETSTNPESEALVECWDDELQSVAVVPTSHLKQLYNRRNPLLPPRAADTPPHARNNRHSNNTKIIFPLSPDHLITILQYNSLRAMAVNRTLISGILTTPLDCADEERIHVVPYPAQPELLPPALLPTTLQQMVPHGDWIDLYPCPEGRDRMILAAGQFDEDELWADCIGGLYEGFPDDEMERRGMLAWSPPWHITGWEMSEGFVRKWGWLLRGLPEPLEATNRWRAERGEEPVAYLD